MYFEDLTPYSYCLPYTVSEIRNIGWLDKEFEFNKGSVPNNFNILLREIMEGTATFTAQVNLIRGAHPCNFCGQQKSDLLTGLGSCEIWIPDGKKNYFAAPSQIIHYIDNHEYQPPKEFIRAVTKVNIHDNFDGQRVYDTLIKKYSTNK